MKKVAMAGLLLAQIFLFAACSGRSPATSQSFREAMEGRDFAIIDVSDQYDESIAETALLAVGEKYQVEFFVLASDQIAKDSFLNNKATIEGESGNSSTSKSISAANYDTHSQATSDKYSVVSRIDNTMLYLSIPRDCENEADEIVEFLGY